MKRPHRIGPGVCLILLAAAWSTAAGPVSGTVEIIRDTWGIPHVFAVREHDGYFGVGFACAEDRIVQMELLRRRATGRLAEIFGAQWVDSDRKFRLAGMPRYFADAFANLPNDLQNNLRSYAAGVNAWTQANPERARKRFAPLGITPEPWTPADSLAAWTGVAELFDSFINESAVSTYRDFQQLVAEAGEPAALARRGMVIDDWAAVVPESEMAKDKKVYARLKAMKPQPGYRLHAAERNPLRFSHAWAIDSVRSVTGRPILESDPQTSVNNPPLWYEFHLCAGRCDARGIGVAGCPAFLIGWNRRIAWGATALGTGCNVTFIEKLSPDNCSYRVRDKIVAFDRRLERIDVADGQPVIQEVLTNPHGFVFNSVARENRPGEALVSGYRQAQDKGSSIRAMMEWMRASDWPEFRAASEHYYSPGLHVVFADVSGNLAYQTLVHLPLTLRTPRMSLEGWTGDDEVRGRIPLAELPHMLNPDSHAISHANNLPVGSWYPYDLGLATGGIGDTARSMRLRQILTGTRTFSVEDFEAIIHRDNVDAPVSAMLPVARKVVAEDNVEDPMIRRVLDSLREWDGHYDAAQPAYASAMALANPLGAFRGSPLGSVVGGGEGGICHLARLLGERFAQDGVTPKDPAAREFLVAWLRMAGGGAPPWASRGRGSAGRASGRPMGDAPERPRARPQVAPARPSREVHAMPWQQNGPLRFPAIDPALDLNSPPLVCGNGSTIWSQKGNSYTQIVDLADLDNSRSVLPPGISEDPESRHHTDQMDIWARGATHPAPLSRNRIEAMAASSMTLHVARYKGADSSGEKLARSSLEGAARFVPAIPPVAAPDAAAGGSLRAENLPGRKPDDPQLETALRYLINQERTAAEVDAKIAELRGYIKGNDDLTRQMTSGLRLVLFLNYGTDDAKAKMRVFLKNLGGELPPPRPR